MADFTITKEMKVPMWDQMQVFCERIADHQIRFVLRFDNMLDKDILKMAIKHAVEQNPIVCASYAENSKSPLWRFLEIDVDKVFSYEKCQDAEHRLKDILIRQIDTLGGPQLLISLIRSKTDTLVLNCNHAITDAAGVKLFAYQLAKNYTRISQNVPFSEQTGIPSRGLKVLSKKLGIKEKSSILKALLTNRKNAATFHRNMDLNTFQIPGFKTYTMVPAEFDRFKAFGKQYSATLNDLLITVFYHALKNISANSNKTNRISYSADIRKYLGDEKIDVLSNYSAIHNIDVDNSITDFVGLLKEISTLTKARKNMSYDLADFPLMAVLFKLIPYQKLKGLFYKQFDNIKTGKSIASPSLSNIGVIEESKIVFDTIVPEKAYVVGGINHPGLLQIAVSTYKKHLTLSIGSYLNEKNEEYVSMLIEAFKITIEKEVLSLLAASSTNEESI